jgi:hypothetical protein
MVILVVVKRGFFSFRMPWAMVQLLVELESLRIPISSISHKDTILMAQAVALLVWKRKVVLHIVSLVFSVA